MARLLYYESPRTAEWQTEVVNVLNKEGKYHVVLAETNFYPEGGGQPADRGTIAGIPVEHVYEQVGEVYHVLPSAPADKIVACKLDFARRFDLMQQHTGQHLLSAVMFNKYGWETGSLHMGEDELSIDVQTPDVTPEALKEIEAAANDVVTRDLEIKTHIVTPEEAKKFPNRKIPPTAGTIRIVEISTHDFSPCCGTHVARTGEIGMIKITGTQKMKNEMRLFFKCGGRALRDYQAKQEIITKLSQMFKADQGKLLARIEAHDAEAKAHWKELTDLKEKLLKVEAGDLARSATSPVIRKTYEDKSFNDLMSLSKYLLQAGDFIMILASVPEKRLLFARSEKYSIDCGKLMKEHLAAFNGKGGGKPAFANAGFNTVEDMQKFEAFLADKLSS
ncbi:alanyl-tRNA editing protein [Methanocella sp. MCL-LM]|uniref:alanyl-tRNA editing protein n=1 Tax=Methanocella sp. MCL-LM TaxID=3412035 RepID=UPI003C768F56